MLLILLILIPFIGSFLSLLSIRLHNQCPRIIALLSTSCCFLISLYFFLKNFLRYSDGVIVPRWISEFSIPWISNFGIFFHIGLDRLSLLMVILTSFIGILAVLCEWYKKYKNIGVFYFLFLLIITATLGVFLSLDLFVFFCFLEFLLFPIYFLIVFWGNSYHDMEYSRLKAARKFFIYSQLSGLFFLISILLLVWVHYIDSGIWTFDYFLLQKTPMSFFIEFLLMCGFFISFAIKMPLVPFHNWLSTLQMFTPSSGSIDLIGILLKTSVYGFLRFSVVFCPRTIHYFSSFFLAFGIFSVMYGAFLAFSQNNIKKFISYSSISHMGILFMALHSENITAYQGIILYIISYTLSASAFLIITGIMQSHAKTYNITCMNNIFSNCSILSVFFLFFSLINLGLPCTGNFSGEFMMLWGIFCSSPWFGTILFFVFIFSAVYCLNIINKVLYELSSFNKKYLEVSWLQISILLILVMSLVFLGLYPDILINFVYDTITYLYKPYISFVLNMR